MDRVVRERIEQAFEDYKDPLHTEEYETVTGFFWTRQDSLLPNNAAFETNGNVIATSRCGGVEYAVADVPPEALEIQHDVTINHKKHVSQGRVAASSDRSTMRFVDIHGRLSRRKPSGTASNGAVLLLMYDRSSGILNKRLMLP
jgi:hypothetical protein